MKSIEVRKNAGMGIPSSDGSAWTASLGIRPNTRSQKGVLYKFSLFEEKNIVEFSYLDLGVIPFRIGFLLTLQLFPFSEDFLGGFSRHSGGFEMIIGKSSDSDLQFDSLGFLLLATRWLIEHRRCRRRRRSSVIPVDGHGKERDGGNRYGWNSSRFPEAQFIILKVA